MIEHSRLLELLHYCPVSGVFTRKIALSHRSKVGEIAGNFNHGYVELSVDGKVYRAHNLAWFYIHGVWPKYLLDHKDRNKSNNAISNLREATSSQNGANTCKSKSNRSGFKGVTSYGFKFKAAIMVNRKRVHLGVFDKARDAAIIYDVAAIKYFGNFAKTNKQLGYI